MVQEPGLTLLQEAGAHVLANLMDLEDADTYLGGPYAFMGVAARTDELDQRLDQMQRLGRALAAGLRYTREAPIDEIVSALPAELVAGGDTRVLAQAVDAHPASLCPSSVESERPATERVGEPQ